MKVEGVHCGVELCLPTHRFALLVAWRMSESRMVCGRRSPAAAHAWRNWEFEQLGGYQRLESHALLTTFVFIDSCQLENY